MIAMPPKVLVTGANGFTGSYFCQYLAERGVPTRGMYYPPDGAPEFSHANLELVPGDLLDRDSLRRALDGIEVVQNIAALYRPTNVPEKLYWDVNVDGVRNMVEEAVAAGVKRFVQCSTMGVHGTVDDPPGNEDSPIKPDDYYQLTKYKGEVLALERGRELGLWVSVARPAGIYGPRESRFLKLAKLVKSGRFIMFGNGEVTYHFVHVDDLCAGLVLCAERDEAKGETFILGDEQAISLKETVAVVAAGLGVPRPKITLPYFVLYIPSALCEFACKPFGIAPPLYRRRAAWFASTRAFDISKAKERLGYQPKVRPQDGLKQMVQSFREAGWI
jgi:nucleoside-diphosphate-sugar epimerase